MSFLALSSFIRAELLVVKKTNEGFAPLSLEEDKSASSKIAEILLKYQWPMCIASNLTPEEQDELLTPGKPYAEELFIQKKIREVLGSDDYCVVFLPTVLYELFCMRDFISGNTPDPFFDVAQKDFDWDGHGKGHKIDLSELLKSNNLPHKIRKKIFIEYKKVNAPYFKGSYSPYFYINNECVRSLFEKYLDLRKSEDAADFSQKIKEKAAALANNLNLEFSSIDLNKFVKKIGHPEISIVTKAEWKKYSHNDLLSRIIALEYEARELNKALLIRGSSFEMFQVKPGLQPQRKKLMGSSLVKQDRAEGDDVSFEAAYGEKKNSPYTLSFGTSLFAGVLGDRTACAFNFLTNSTLVTSGYDREEKMKKIPGYAILIDKKAYIEHQINNLFFIPSLAPIAALFTNGEYFHARTKAAIAIKEHGKMEVLGFWGWLEDTTGVILITRDPLRHAELFSNYLAENGRLIQTGDNSLLSEEERTFMEEAVQSQKEAARFYKSVRLVTPKIKAYTKKLKERVRAKKEKAVTAPQVK
jgi:hypothetical protein